MPQQKKKRDKRYDSSRYVTRSPGSAELMWWLKCGQDRIQPEKPLSAAGQQLAAEVRDKLVTDREALLAEKLALTGPYDELIRWLDVGAEGAVPPGTLSVAAANLAASFRIGMR